MHSQNNIITMEEQLNTEQNYNEFANPKPVRPTGLSIACVLSFINAGFQFLANIFWFLAYNAMKELGQNEDYLEMMEKFSPNNNQFESTLQAQLAVNRINYLLMALLFVASFYGVLQMWKLQKQGFHIYSISQILILIVTAVFVTSVTGASIVGPAILTAIWIGIYFIYYRKVME